MGEVGDVEDMRNVGDPADPADAGETSADIGDAKEVFDEGEMTDTVNIWESGNSADNIGELSAAS